MLCRARRDRRRPSNRRNRAAIAPHERICHWPLALDLRHLEYRNKWAYFLLAPMDWSVFRPDAMTLSYGHKNMMPSANKGGAPQKNLILFLSPSFLRIVGSVILMRFTLRLISLILLVSALVLPPVVAVWADSDSLSTSGGSSVGQVDVSSCQDDAAQHGEAEDSCCAPEHSCPPQFCISTSLVPLIIGASTHEIPDQEIIAFRIIKAEHLRSRAIGLLFPPPRT